MELVGVWLRTTAAAALVAAVLVSVGWASIMAWRSHVAPAHVVALVVFFWGSCSLRSSCCHAAATR